jgi:hypothetical protein
MGATALIRDAGGSIGTVASLDLAKPLGRHHHLLCVNTVLAAAATASPTHGASGRPGATIF